MGASVGLAARLVRQRRLARASVVTERAWPELAPVAGLVVVGVCVALLGLPERLPAIGHTVLLVAFAIGVVWLAWRGVSRVIRPTAAEVDRRLEAASGFAHRPLAVLADRPVGFGDTALWRAHRARADRAVAGLRWPPPRLSLGARDPFGLAGLLLVALVACLAVAGPDAPARLLDAIVPHLPRAAPAAQPLVSAWATPPGYTSLPPFALPAADGTQVVSVAVPEGSRIEVSVSGTTQAPVVTAPQAAKPPVEPLDAGSFRAAAQPTGSGLLAVEIGTSALGRWNLAIVPDLPPSVAWVEPPAVTRTRTPGVRFQWTATHAYGVDALAAELRLRDRPDAPPLTVTMPLPGPSPRSAHGIRTEDLTAHPWAGLAVRATLIGRDGAGKIGRGGTAELTLPERAFSHPMARALVAARKNLVLGAPGPVADTLDTLADDAPAWTQEAAGLAQLRGIATGLRAPTPAIQPAFDGLWALALHLEESGPARTAATLAQAQKALRDSLPTKDRAAIDKKAHALADALARHAQALAEARRRDPSLSRPDTRAARDALDKLRQAERNGQDDAAQADMAELDRALQALRDENRDEASRARQRAEKARQSGAKNLTAMSDLLRREGKLVDRAQGREAEGGQPFGSLNFPPGGLSDAYRDPAVAAHDADPAARAADRAMQSALRRVLGELMSLHGELTATVPPELGIADQAMRDASTALGAAQDDIAAGDMERAILALQKGGQAMRDQVRQKYGPQQQGRGQDGQNDNQDSGDGQDPGNGQGSSQSQQGADQFAQGQDDSGPDDGSGYGAGDLTEREGQGRDPFGRALGQAGAGAQYGDGSDTKIPGADAGGRARAVQQELRRRDADLSRRPEERDYIGRLLGPH